MSATAKPKGQPVVALLAVLAGWMGGRLITWEPPKLEPAAASPAGATLPDGSTYAAVGAGPQSIPGMIPASYSPDYYGSGYPAAPMAGNPWAYGPPPTFFAVTGRSWAQPVLAPAVRGGRRAPLFIMWDMVQAADARAVPALVPVAGGYQPLEGGMIETAPRFFAPGNLPDVNHAAAPAAGASSSPPDGPRRHWSMDAWALIRNEGASAPSPGVLPATYGGSQSGAVLRYRIDPYSPYRLSMYMRTTSALGGIRDNTIALGVSARPVPSIPVIAAVEGRMVDQASGRSIRPAALAYTEIPPLPLPARLRAEAYLQGGYVGGRFATPFADGMIRVDRQVLNIGKAEVRAGGGIWGGAQKGAARLDAGPSASLTMPLSKGLYGRAALDWRFRVAGDAMPGSGPALTLSAGF